MAKADLTHLALEKVPFYEARLIHRKDIHTASVHSAELPPLDATVSGVPDTVLPGSYL